MKSIIDFLRRRRIERDLADEIEAHLSEKIADLMDAGMPEQDARAAAQREFGNVTRYREIGREVWGWTWLETLWQDVRYGARVLGASPSFTAAAVITLALGIAVNSSIFSVLNALLLQQPPGVADPDRVAAVVATNKSRALDRGRISAVDYGAWRDANHSFTDLSAVVPFENFNLTGSGDPERVDGMRVTSNYFQTLGVSAFLGRTFLADEDQPGREHVLVIDYRLWANRFGSDPSIVGKTIGLDGEKYIVIGVLPAAFRQAAFLSHAWIPLVLPVQDAQSSARNKRSLILIGRLKSDASMAQARAEFGALAQRAEQHDSASEKGWGANVMSLQEYGIEEDHTRSAALLLMTTVALVLLLACANIANLLLARASKRQQEIAVRTALGAGRLRVIRQLLVESLLIAIAGGCLGLLGANWGIHLFRSRLNFNEYISTMAEDIRLDHRVLIFTCLISIGAALIFGLAPAIRISGADPQRTLRLGGRMGDLRRGWGRNVLVGGQIALAMLLVISAGLMMKATAEQVGGDFGFDATRILAAAVSLNGTKYHEPARQMAFVDELRAKLDATPGVQAAAISNSTPFAARRREFSIREQLTSPGIQQPRARYISATPEFFRVMSIPLVQGRAFRDSDSASAHRIAIVNRAFVSRFFPGQNALGRYIRIEGEHAEWSEIVGIVGNVKFSDGPKEEDAQMYEPFYQSPVEPEMWITMRGPGDVTLLARAARRAVWSVDPEQPLGRVETIEHIMNEHEGGDYVMSILLGSFAAMALVLAAIGIYGVVAYSVAQRRHEIGIRIALGAHRGDVLRPVLVNGMLLAVVSASLGLVAALPMPQLFKAMFEGYDVHSVAIFAAVPAFVLLVAFVAIYIPASRVLRVDPMEALRYE